MTLVEVASLFFAIASFVIMLWLAQRQEELLKQIRRKEERIEEKVDKQL